METFTHVEEHQNNIFPEVKKDSERDVEMNVEGKGSL